MTRLNLAIRGLTARSFLVLVLILVMAGAVQAGTTVTRNDGLMGGVDGTIQERPLVFSGGSFPAGSVVTNVDVTVVIEKIDGGGGDLVPEHTACTQLGGAGHQGGSVWHPEIYIGVVSPEGTRVTLVEDDVNTGGSGAGPTYTSNTYSGVSTITFTENTGTVVGGPTPVSGTFLPVQLLTAFNGENPVGTWVVELGDNFPEDPLCSGSVTVAITTATGYEIGTNMTASFGDPAFNGQGINTEILSMPTVAKDGEKGGPGLFVMYWYTFDIAGFPIWAFGVGTFAGDTMVVDMLIDYDGTGPIFGPGYNPAQFNGLPFATVIITWASCGQGLMSWVFDPSFLALNPGFVAHTMNMQRITNVVGLPVCL